MSNTDRRWKYALGSKPRQACKKDGRLAMYHPMSGRMTDVLVGCDSADTCKDFLIEGRCVLTELKEKSARTHT